MGLSNLVWMRIDDQAASATFQNSSEKAVFFTSCNQRAKFKTKIHRFMIYFMNYFI